MIEIVQEAIIETMNDIKTITRVEITVTTYRTINQFPDTTKDTIPETI